MAVTLNDIKVKWRYKARSKMSSEELEYFNNYVDKHRKETIRLEELLIKQNLQANEWIIVSPMFLPLRKKETPDKKFWLNMNQMRNRNFITSNNLKKEYKIIMNPYISKLKKLKKIKIEYKIFYWKNIPDWMNIQWCISKFFLDTLVEEWYIDDDNINYVVSELWISWWKDIGNERVEIKITEL